MGVLAKGGFDFELSKEVLSLDFNEFKNLLRFQFYLFRF